MVAGLVCGFCRQEAVHNTLLRITFCPVHGLSAPLEPKGVHRAIASGSLPLNEAPGSWAVPAG